MAEVFPTCGDAKNWIFDQIGLGSKVKVNELSLEMLFLEVYNFSWECAPTCAICPPQIPSASVKQKYIMKTYATPMFKQGHLHTCIQFFLVMIDKANYMPKSVILDRNIYIYWWAYVYFLLFVFHAYSCSQWLFSSRVFHTKAFEHIQILCIPFKQRLFLTTRKLARGLPDMIANY